MVLMLAVDEADVRVKQTPMPNHTSDAAVAAAAAGGDASHYSVLSHGGESSSADNKAASWTSKEVMSWLERSRLQHLNDWYQSINQSIRDF